MNFHSSRMTNEALSIEVIRMHGIVNRNINYCEQLIPYQFSDVQVGPIPINGLDERPNLGTADQTIGNHSSQSILKCF